MCDSVKTFAPKAASMKNQENDKFTNPEEYRISVTSNSVRNVTKSTPSMHATTRVAHNPELVWNIESISQMEHVQCRRIEISAWVRITFTETRKIIGHKSCPKFFQKGCTDSRDPCMGKNNVDQIIQCWKYQYCSENDATLRYSTLPASLDERKE